MQGAEGRSCERVGHARPTIGHEMGPPQSSVAEASSAGGSSMRRSPAPARSAMDFLRSTCERFLEPSKAVDYPAEISERARERRALHR